MPDLTPSDVAGLDQAGEEIARLLETFGCDRRDPAAMRGALAAIQTLACVFQGSPGMDRDGILRGYLLNLARMQP